MGGSKKACGIIRQALCIRLQLNQPIDGSIVKVKAIVTNAISYIVLFGGVVLYPMGFTLDLWGKMTSYRVGWQFRDGKSVHLLIHFVGKGALNPKTTMPHLVTFSWIVNCGGDLLNGKVSSQDFVPF